MIEDVEVPEGWRRVRLGEVAHINMGQSPPSNVVNESEKGIPFLQGNAEFTDKYPIPQKWIMKPLKLSRKNDILISVRAPVGAINKANMDYCIGRGLAAISFKSIDGEFGWFGLIHWKHQLETLSQGSTFEAISKDDLKNLLLLIPAFLPEQRKITEILETVDNAIERTDTIIEKYKQIKQGLMQDLLTRGVVENDELGVMNYELRDEKKHGFKDSPLGRISEEWEVVRLGEAAEITSSKRIYFDEYSEEGIPFYRSKEIIEKSQNKPIDKVLYVSKKKFEVIKKYFGAPETGDILITSVGTLGVTYLVKQKDGEFYFKDGNLIWLRHWNQKINKKFFIYMFSDNFNKQKEDLTIGTSQKALTIEKMKRMEILCPPLPEQHRIAKMLSQMDQTIEKEHKYKQKLERIKQGLMEDLLTGKVRVNHLIKEGMENVQPA